MEKCERNEQIYESLEAIHVFALAHILKRPIIGFYWFLFIVSILPI